MAEIGQFDCIELSAILDFYVLVMTTDLYGTGPRI